MYVYIYIYIYISDVSLFFSGRMNTESHARTVLANVCKSKPPHTCNNFLCPSNIVEIGVLEKLGIALSETSMRSVTDPKSGPPPNMSSAHGIFSEGMLVSLNNLN